MRITRIYTPHKLVSGHNITLGENASNHLLHVLRLRLNSPLILFNGEDIEYQATIKAINQQKRAIVEITKPIPSKTESPLKIRLVQAISKGEKMDYIIQKAVELGVNKITPVFTARCIVKLDSNTIHKKQQRWQNIAISACEQCGRTKIPKISTPQKLELWLTELQSETEINLVLTPEGCSSLATLPKPQKPLTLLIGPEGGLTSSEISLTKQRYFIPIKLGPRILRTETAALAAISTLQTIWGDFL